MLSLFSVDLLSSPQTIIFDMSLKRAIEIKVIQTIFFLPIFFCCRSIHSLSGGNDNVD